MDRLDATDDATVVCPHCGSVVPASFRFCGHCGRPLTTTCRHCAATLPAGFRFCGACGTPVDPTAARGTVMVDAGTHGVAEERRVVSVLAADLEGSTRLATTLDAEELHHTVQPLLDALAEEVAAHGGTLQRYAGDGAVAVFGAPVARGDDAVRAVRAALALHERVRRLNATSDLPDPLVMRIGVATGDVVTIADDPALGRATGEAFNLASRLQTVAPAGEVAVDRRTWRDTRHAIAYRPTAGPHHLKGFPEPLAVWIAADEQVRDTRYRMPLVGRFAELRTLSELLRGAAVDSTVHAVTVVGEPGVGKSRLVHEFVTVEVPTAVPDARVVAGRCLPYGRGPALWPLAEILRADLGARLGEPAEQLAARAQQMLTTRWPASDDADLVRVLLASVGLPARAGRQDVTTAHAASRDIVARLVGRAWRSYLETLADGGPLVVRIEDLHWGDDDLFAVLDVVLTTARFPLLLVATARPRVEDGHATLAGDVVHLEPLDRADTHVLVRRLLGDAAPEPVVNALCDRAGGNPFFAEQLVEVLREEGTLDTSTDPLADLRVRLPDRLPDSVQAAIGARLDLLSPTERAVVLHAAVVGRSWWPGVVAHLLGRPVDDDVDRLVARGMCIEQPESEIHGEDQMLFGHALLRDVAYERVPRRLRRRLHRDVGRWIEERASGREQEITEILAHHFELAREHEATARYALIAGERKLALFAADEAIMWLTRAQAASARVERPSDTDLACRIALRTGAAHEQLGAYALAEEHYKRALRAAEEARRDGRRAEALVAASHVLWLEDAYDRAEPLLAEALASAEALARADLLGQVQYTTGTIRLGRGQYAQAAQAQREALATAHAAGDREAEALALHGVAEALAFTGPLTAALQHAVACSQLVRSLGWLPMLYHNESMRGWILMWMGRLPEADDALNGAGRGAIELGDPRNAAHALAGRGTVRWLLGDTAGAWDLYRRSEELERRFNGPRTLLMIKVHELYPLADEDRWAEARATLDQCWEASDATGGRFLRAQLYAWEGWMALRAGDEETAARRFAEAQDCAGEIRTERWYALSVELAARLATDDAERLAELGRALRDLGVDSSAAHALGDLAAVSAAAAGATDQAELVDGIEGIEADLPPRYRWRLWHEAARLRDRQGRADDAAAAHARSERALSAIRPTA